jgi:hypothetical protein
MERQGFISKRLETLGGIVPAFVVMWLSIQGCALDTPPLVKKAALEDLPKVRAQALYEPVSKERYQDLRIVCGRRHELTRDDEAHGIAEMWCVVVVGRVFGSPVGNQWVDLNQELLVMRLAGTERWGATLPREVNCSCP